jgi:hypothetical protein
MSCDSAFEFSPASIGGQIVQAFESSLLDENACRLYLLQTLRPAPVCPYCNCSFHVNLIDRIYNQDRQITCPQCNRRSSPRAGTVLEGVHATYRQIMLLAIMIHWQIPLAEISKCVGVSTDTVRRFCERLNK